MSRLSNFDCLRLARGELRDFSEFFFRIGMMMAGQTKEEMTSTFFRFVDLFGAFTLQHG